MKFYTFSTISLFLFASFLGNSSAQDSLKTYKINETIIVGSKSNMERSIVESNVPADVINSEQIIRTGATEVTQLLNLILPSFSSQRQTFADGNDHIDPATLRNLGPDQVLVLVNGKRRHTSSLVTVTPVVGKGSVGVDFNAIPINAIDRIEVLRDGASTQYGSDAIAGVINIILKKNVDNLMINSQIGITSQGDGKFVEAGVNYGLPLTNNGFINFTLQGSKREPTNRNGDYNGLVYRTANQDSLTFEENYILDSDILNSNGLKRSDFNLKIGNSELMNIGGAINAELPINNNLKLLANTIINYRDSKAPGYYRLPNDIRNNLNVYPNGFLPYLRSKIQDNSFNLAAQMTQGAWIVELSNATGLNCFDFFVENSLNRAYEDSTPRNFEAGGLQFLQNTTNLDLRRDLGEIIGINYMIFNLGAEFRYEKYKQIAGERSSWYAPNPNYEPGAQIFPGFGPNNEIDKNRTSIGAYVDLESNFSNTMFLTLGTRFENYSDFGSAFALKLANRINIIDKYLNLRFSANTGYRAPSLQQKYYNKSNTFFINFNSVFYPFDVATLIDVDPIVQALTSTKLKAEKSINYSIGLTSQPFEYTTITIDAYMIDIDDRIVLSGYFMASDPKIAELIKDLKGVDAFQFFTNAINTRTKGIDIVLNQHFDLDNYGFTTLSFAANISEIDLVGDIKIPNNLIDTSWRNSIFSREEIGRFKNAQPNTKFYFSLNHKVGNFNANIRLNYYGKVQHLLNDPTYDQTFTGKTITDLSLAYRFFESMNLKFMVQNLFDIYPDKNKDIMQDYGRFPYNTAVSQFGFNGQTFVLGLDINL